MADVSFQIRAGVSSTYPTAGRSLQSGLSTKFLVLGFVAQKREYQSWVNLIPVITGEEYNVEVTASSGCRLYSL